MSTKLVWVGPRESDILFSNVNFVKTVTYNGSNTGNNIAFTSLTKTRIDHNYTDKWDLKNFLADQLLQLVVDTDIRFLFYNALQAYSLGKDVVKHTLCMNQRELLRHMRNKGNMRVFAQQYIPVVPYVEFSGKDLPKVSFHIGEKDSYVLQQVFSSSGHGTLQLTQEECMHYIANHPKTDKYILSPYIKNGAPINVHVVIFEDRCIVLPPSFQLIRRNGPYFSYIGGDFHTCMAQEMYDLILQRTNTLAEGLRLLGYRGVCGIDYMLTENELYFLEVNPRFQASSFLLNKLLQKGGLPSLHQLHISAFVNRTPPIESFSQFADSESFFSVSEEIPTWFSADDKGLPKTISSVILDGYCPDMKVEENAYLFRAISNRNLCWLDQDFRLQIAPNLQPDSDTWKAKIMSKDPLCIKIGLLNQGVRISREAAEQMGKIGSIRQGVFQSVDLFLPNSMVVNAPYHTDFSDFSPYCIEWVEGEFKLSYRGSPLFAITFDAEDLFRGKIATKGTAYRNVAFWATDRLRVHHQLSCRFKAEGKGCHFCNTRSKDGPFFIEDVCEVVDYYLTHANFRHFLIGGGSGAFEAEQQNILTLVKHIRSQCDKSIYVMCLPPKDISALSEYHAAGVNEIGFNLELYDRDRAKEIMPGKGAIPLSQYENAYQEAVRLWGNRGNVRSLMVLGLEKEESFFSGIDWLCQLGVMPIVSVFRPVSRIELSMVLPPQNEDLKRIFSRAQKIASNNGLVLGPSCTACQNNTLSLPISHETGRIKIFYS